MYCSQAASVHQSEILSDISRKVCCMGRDNAVNAKSVFRAPFFFTLLNVDA